MRSTCRLTRGRRDAGPMVWRLFLLRSSRAREVKPTRAWSANISILLCCKWSSCRRCTWLAWLAGLAEANRWNNTYYWWSLIQEGRSAVLSIALYWVYCWNVWKWNGMDIHVLLPVSHGKCSPADGWCHFLPGKECGDVRVPGTCQLSPGGPGSHSEPAPTAGPGSGRSPAPLLICCCSGDKGNTAG